MNCWRNRGWGGCTVLTVSSSGSRGPPPRPAMPYYPFSDRTSAVLFQKQRFELPYIGVRELVQRYERRQNGSPLTEDCGMWLVFLGCALVCQMAPAASAGNYPTSNRANLPLYNIPTPNFCLHCTSLHHPTQCYRPQYTQRHLAPDSLGEGAGLPLAKRIWKVLLFARHLKSRSSSFFP